MENESQKRTVVAFGLMFVMLTVYMIWFAPSTPPPQAAGAVDAGTVASTAAPAPAPSTTQPSPPPPPSAGTPPAGPPVRTLDVSRKLVHYVFSTEGAGLVSARLLGEKTREQRPLTIAEGWAQLFGKDVPKGAPMNLAEPVPGAALPLSLEFAGEASIPGTLRYSAEQGDHKITFVGRTESWEVTKEVSWVDDGYELATQVTLRNLTGRPLSGELVLPYGRAIDPAHEEKPSMFGGVGNVSDAACFVKDSYEHETVKDKTESKEFSGPVRWVGINQQYFVSAVFPVGTAVEGKCVLTTSLTERVASGRFPIAVGPGQSVTRAFGAFLGPKETEALAAVPTLPANRAAEANVPVHLDRAVDYGIWAALCKPMLWFLKKIHGVVGNWGVAIIFLTVVVKVLLIPLTHRAMVGQEAMKKLQPRIEELKKKFPEDKERQQMEMMKAYQEAGVNPFGSCLMILVQLPVWAALFNTLRNSYELYGEPFTSRFLTDLTMKDPTYLLPVLLGVSQVITSRLQPPALDAAQQRMMVWFMPLFFTFIMLNYPAGLLLYIFTNNILTVAQQAILRRMVGSTPTPPLKPALEKRK
ncbi:MAG TPA: membrane protein insertase YidC [Myxococcaceae bacterium]|nr:membrane protein insertase YidC [Myxococcaceae bacterium]